MPDTDLPSSQTLDYAHSKRQQVRRKPMSVFARWSVFLLLAAIGSWIILVGIEVWGQGRGMSPGYGEHDRLTHVGWALIAIGGLVGYLGLRTLRRGRA